MVLTRKKEKGRRRKEVWGVFEQRGGCGKEKVGTVGSCKDTEEERGDSNTQRGGKKKSDHSYLTLTILQRKKRKINGVNHRGKRVFGDRKGGRKRSSFQLLPSKQQCSDAKYGGEDRKGGGVVILAMREKNKRQLMKQLGWERETRTATPKAHIIY